MVLCFLWDCSLPSSSLIVENEKISRIMLTGKAGVNYKISTIQTTMTTEQNSAALGGRREGGKEAKK